jgi:hypothetical protein
MKLKHKSILGNKKLGFAEKVKNDLNITNKRLKE